MKDGQKSVRDLISDDSWRDVEETLSQEELKAKIQQALDMLTEQETRVLCLYYGLHEQEPMTLEEIGCRFGRTRERVRQIKEKALQRLRHPSINRALREYTAE